MRKRREILRKTAQIRRMSKELIRTYSQMALISSSHSLADDEDDDDLDLDWITPYFKLAEEWLEKYSFILANLDFPERLSPSVLPIVAFVSASVNFLHTPLYPGKSPGDWEAALEIIFGDDFGWEPPCHETFFDHLHELKKKERAAL